MEGQKLTCGVYRVFAPDNDTSFIGFSYNVNGVIKRLRFELNFNACPYHVLQDFWDAHGPLEFELLEECDPDSVDDIDQNVLKASLTSWQNRLGGKVILIQDIK